MLFCVLEDKAVKRKWLCSHRAYILVVGDQVNQHMSRVGRCYKQGKFNSDGREVLFHIECL